MLLHIENMHQAGPSTHGFENDASLNANAHVCQSFESMDAC